MNLELPLPVQFILKQLQTASFDAYIVGGAVRDILLQKTSHDWDFSTNATPDQIQTLFPESYYDNAYGTVGIAGKHLVSMMPTTGWITSQEDYDRQEWLEEVYEITTYRTESAYTDKRRPDHVAWGQSLIEDLKRRDFTINAMALQLVDQSSVPSSYPLEVILTDPYNGQSDLQQAMIKAVGDPQKRFEEDALRMMRAIRFGAQLGFSVESKTLQAISSNAANLQNISWERIRDELLKIIASPFPADGILMLLNSGLLQHIVPEMLATQGIEQAGRHKLDVWNHSLESLRTCPSTDPVVRLATWLHDIGKPKTQRFEGPRGVTFYGHEVVGAHLAKKIAQRLRFSSKDVDRIFTLVRWHMFTYEANMTDAAIKRFIKRVGLANINDMMLLRVGDRKGGGSKATSWRLRELQRRIGENLYEPMSLKDLKINGHDVMEQLSLNPSPVVGQLLQQLFEEVLEDSSKNDRQYLLKRLMEIKPTNS